MARENSENNFRLGDSISRALSLVGVTEERVSFLTARILGVPCGCTERREKLNDISSRLSLWASRVLSGKTTDAEKFLDEIIDPAKE